VFRNNNKDTVGENMTQYGRALHELNIDILCANLPTACGFDACGSHRRSAAACRSPAALGR
jgi:hypothetical protein